MIEGGVVSPTIITSQRKSLCQLYGLLEKDKKARQPVEQHGQYAMLDDDDSDNYEDDVVPYLYFD